MDTSHIVPPEAWKDEVFEVVTPHSAHGIYDSPQEAIDKARDVAMGRRDAFVTREMASEELREEVLSRISIRVIHRKFLSLGPGDYDGVLEARACILEIHGSESGMLHESGDNHWMQY